MRITQRLRCHPVQAVTAVEVASQHAETVGQRARVGMKERLLLNWIALYSTDVSPRDVKLAALVVADLAHAGLALKDGTTMSTGKTTNAIAINRLVKLAFTDVLIQDFTQSGHDKQFSAPILDRLLRGW